MKIGILGGTFDPVHEGHLTLARAARKQFSLDKVLFIPASVPPHKQNIPSVTPAAFRYRMVELALRGEDRFEISDVEFRRQGPSYTCDTIERLKALYPGDEFFLILGEDNWANLAAWRNPENIRKSATLLVARRSSAGAREIQAPQEGVLWIDMPETPVAASRIRERIKNRQALVPGELPAAVEEYIRRMNLYGEAEADAACR
jgi:nicotinate-nucleotide adenylyltransferase